MEKKREKWLTGSARITTTTVAFPGVSRLTSGVTIVPPASFTLDSIWDNWAVGQEKATRPKALQWSTFSPISVKLKLIYIFKRKNLVFFLNTNIFEFKFSLVFIKAQQSCRAGLVKYLLPKKVHPITQWLFQVRACKCYFKHWICMNKNVFLNKWWNIFK